MPPAPGVAVMLYLEILFQGNIYFNIFNVELQVIFKKIFVFIKQGDRQDKKANEVGKPVKTCLGGIYFE